MGKSQSNGLHRLEANGIIRAVKRGLRRSGKNRLCAFGAGLRLRWAGRLFDMRGGACP